MTPTRLLCLMLLCAPSGLLQAADAPTLRARHQALAAQLASNQFQRPLYLESSQADNQLQGDIYAEVAQPFAKAGPALQGIEQWCELLILHLNVKGCHASAAGAQAVLKLHVGRKFDQALADAYPFAFRYQVQAATADYLRVALQAAEGPLGTRDYRIVLEVLALDEQRSFLHLSYAYTYGAAANLAMQGYLATTGRDKVGFSIIGQTASGQPVYQGDMRGVVERNTMRYYLAVDAYLGALGLPAAARQEQRLNDWHSGVERYPRQLHELERADYLAMKYQEIERQQALQQGTVVE
ncbi:hypothetical protein [Aquipseudomonas guryensis]|jgi:hypothetical protein|uniref:Uncharacterized protein n=1 Tax=Aquipseudomonas guryensis TaxID=2759165 RepID=A0A7W4DES8_9GAMM|nr:hypothetical protein [Pseudomonas guryensis]MBB1521265.1 hypothetical protein [Pseudomonas guryensis]